MTALSYLSFIGSLAFETRGRELLPCCVGEKYTQYVFETLFGIPSDPVTFMACDRLLVYMPLDPSKKVQQFNFVENIMKYPQNWDQKEMVKFMTAHKSHVGALFSDIIFKIEEGRGTFKQLFDPEAFGDYILFCVLTEACLTPANLGLVRKGNKFGPKRISFDSFLRPLFQLTNDQKHQFIGHNILYLLPFMSENIPDSVKNKFLENDIHLVLSNALVQLTTLQNHYNQLINSYKLDTSDDLSQALNVEITKARALGLALAGRPETIAGMIKRFNKIQENLATPGCTYEFIQQQVNPLEFQCYEYILTNARKKTETIPLFFESIIPSIIEQIRIMCKQAEHHDETPPYTSEELSSFEKAIPLYLKKIEGYRSGMEKLYVDRVTNKQELEEMLQEQRCLLETATNNVDEISNHPHYPSLF